MRRSLYKYLSVDTEERLCWALGYLRGRAYFSSPNAFNDPFEMSTPISAPTDDEAEKLINELLGDHQTLSKTGMMKLRREVQLKVEREDLVVSTEDWLKDIGVLCLTEDPLNLLMWAHYADCHRGICIGFDSGESIFSGFEKVNYVMERPKIPFSCKSHLDDESLKKIIYTKSIEWKYEKEWRSVRRTVKEEEKQYYNDLYERGMIECDDVVDVLIENSGPGIYEFDSSCIRKIYLGSKIESSKKARILDHIERLKLKVKVVQLSLDMKHYWFCSE